MRKSVGLWAIITVAVLSAFLVTCATCSYFVVSNVTKEAANLDKILEGSPMQSAQEMQNNDLSSGIDNAFDSNSGMEITAWKEVNIIGGSDVSIKVINNTEKTVSAFEVAYELIDGFGEPVSGFASLSGSGIRLGKVADCEIAPGKSLAGTFTELTAFAKVSRVAVIRVGFADGTQWISPGYEAVRNSG